MKKKKLKLLRAIAAEMVKKGAPQHSTLNYVNEEKEVLRTEKVPMNHYRQMKRLMKNNKMPIGHAIDQHASKFFDMNKVVQHKAENVDISNEEIIQHENQ